MAKHDAYSLRLTPRASKQGGFGLPVSRSTAYLTSEAMDGAAQANPSEPEPGTDPPQADWSGGGERPATGYGEPEAGAIEKGTTG